MSLAMTRHRPQGSGKHAFHPAFRKKARKTKSAFRLNFRSTRNAARNEGPISFRVPPFPFLKGRANGTGWNGTGWNGKAET
jgi:hypothetical protein